MEKWQNRKAERTTFFRNLEKMSQRRNTKNEQIAALKAQVNNLTETQKDLIQMQKKCEAERMLVEVHNMVFMIS